MRNLPLGPVMVDLAAFELSEHERARLLHPNVGGVILFGRNYRDKAQLRTYVSRFMPCVPRDC